MSAGGRVLCRATNITCLTNSVNMLLTDVSTRFMAYRCFSTKEASFMVFGFYFISKFSLLHVILMSKLRRMIWLC